MVRYLLCFLFLSVHFISTAMRQMDAESALNYKIKWETIGLDSKGFDFHKACAERLAKNKVLLGIENPSNLAIVGLSIHNATNCKYVAFPHIVYSTYNTSEDAPSTDDSGVSLMSIADMMRSDIVEGKTRTHRISDFLFHLFSFGYTRDWNLYSGIKKCSEIIGRRDFKEMSRIPEDSSIAEVLHCEQVFLYRTLVKDGIFDSLIGNLLAQEGILDFLRSPTSYITFDIVTYNDMCPKCFSTCYHMSEILSSKINEAITRKTKTDGTFFSIFDARGGKPFNVSIQVSSFRPYPTVRKATGKYHLYSRATYVNKMEEPIGIKRVSQFFNPWIAQHVFACEFVDFIESVRRLKLFEPVDVYTINGLFEKLRVLQENKEIEPQTIRKISDAFFKDNAMFLTRADLSFSVLPLAIELCNIVRDENFLTFIGDSINKLDSTGKNRVLKADVPEIVSIPANQNEIFKTLMLLQASVPDGFGWYDFTEMAQAAEQINLANVHPMIIEFIKRNVADINKKISAKHPSTRLQKALNKISEYNGG